jgi:hypothetical protein
MPSSSSDLTATVESIRVRAVLAADKYATALRRHALTTAELQELHLDLLDEALGHADAVLAPDDLALVTVDARLVFAARMATHIEADARSGSAEK